MVKVYSDPRYKINTRSIKKSTRDILDKKGIEPEYNLNIVFVGKRKMKQVSANYKKEAIALPVLSFSYINNKKTTGGEVYEEEKMLGEVLICYPQALLLAAEREKTVNTILLQLIEHGIENIINS